MPLDVFLLLDRDIVGVQIPSESELHEDLGKGYAIELKGGTLEKLKLKNAEKIVPRPNVSMRYRFISRDSLLMVAMG